VCWRGRVREEGKKLENCARGEQIWHKNSIESNDMRVFEAFWEGEREKDG
jgi:hypothetical protein